MSFNTAIFWDIENLLKGYSFTQEVAADLSLAEIVGAIKKARTVNQIAIQRAYANWSDPRLGIMRGEINELAIEPIQVFGFGREPSKNAADIQLAIDAVDLAHSRPGLEVFVIVSGDGAFSALAKKLHEYGKTVVGCAYTSAASRIFQAVCDEFIFVADPEAEDRAAGKAEGTPLSRPKACADPRNARLGTRIQPLRQPLDEQSVVKKTKDLLQFYADEPTCKADLESQGVVLSVFQEAFRYLAPGFEIARLGFPKLIEYLQWVTSGTPLCVARRQDFQPVLAFRATAGGIGEVLPDLEPREVHSQAVYRMILAADPPLFRLPTADETQRVVAWVAERPPAQRRLGEIIEDSTESMPNPVPTESAKRIVLALVSSGVFVREPEGLPIAEQNLTLPPELRSKSALMERLRQAVTNKLRATLGQVRGEIVDQIVPRAF